MSQPFIIDAHLDLSMNALEWNRDLRESLDEINRREVRMTDKPDRAKATISFAELRKGNIGLIVATQIGRYVAPNNTLPGWHSPEQAWAQTQGQLAWYKAMEEDGQMTMIRNRAGLDTHLALWYANGTDSSGCLNAIGKELLREMDRLGMILDVTHLCDEAFWETLSIYKGPVWASHNNCRAFVDHNRQFSDDMIKALIEREAVIGIALDAWMMVPGWVRGVSTPEGMRCNLEIMVNNMDHVCQLAGNVNHVAIGSDLDGAFGTEQCPYDLRTIADIQKVPVLLKNRGYNDSDIEQIASGNWIRFIRKALD